MKLLDKACTAEQSDELKRFGVNQDLQPGDVYFATLSSGDTQPFLLSEQEDLPPSMYKPVKAFDCATLGVLITHCGLYTRFNTANAFMFGTLTWGVHHVNDYTGYCDSSADYMTEAQARAEALIFLLTNKKIDTETVNKLLAEL